MQKIFVIHIDDADHFPRGYLEQSRHRLFPGDGAINLDEILLALKEIGYDDTVSVELFREEYSEWDVEEFIKTAKEKDSFSCRKTFQFNRLLNRWKNKLNIS
ncbi:hypothetical protein GCM10020331_097160 [Ectobacillus funiculus]